MKVNELDYNSLNAMLNLYDENGQIQFDRDKEAARQFFLQHVNKNTWFFHSIEEKIQYLIENDYYDPDVVYLYTPEEIKMLFKQAYSYKFRFPTFVGA